MERQSEMKIEISTSKDAMGAQAAAHGATLIRRPLELHGHASIVLACAASQFEMLAHLVREPGIDWSRVTVFHLDEYIGLPISHPASFRRFLWERFVSQLPLPLKATHYLCGENAETECERVGDILRGHSIDVALIGIGENGHLAFNDPPADFHTEDPYLIVTLDERCRSQQLGEGWFDSLEKVPTRAISMSVRQILKSGAIVCTVPDERKAAAVQAAIEGEITPQVPASILQSHGHAALYLDRGSASQLSTATIERCRDGVCVDR